MFQMETRGKQLTIIPRHLDYITVLLDYRSRTYFIVASWRVTEFGRSGENPETARV